LYPLTCLTSLSKAEKLTLLESGCILVKDMLKDEVPLEKLRLTPSKKRKLIEEAEELVSSAK